jgi:hypothetical protein
MSAIRPGLPQIVPQSADAGRARSAQAAAYFRAAVDQAQTARPATAQASAPAPAVVTTRTTAAAPDPNRPLRPGSLLDIRI